MTNEVGVIKRQAIVIKPGFMFQMTVQVTDATNAPMDLSSYTAGTFDVFDKEGVVLDSFNTHVTVLNSQVLVDLPTATTAAIDWLDGVYELGITRTDNERFCIMEGPIRTDRGD